MRAGKSITGVAKRTKRGGKSRESPISPTAFNMLLVEVEEGGGRRPFYY